MIKKNKFSGLSTKKDSIEDLVDTFAFEEWPFKLLIPAYDGGIFSSM